jgi:hypothetical protein
MASANENLRTPLGVASFTSGVTASTSGGVVPVKHVHTKKMTVIKHRVELPGAKYTVTAASGGAADAQGQKILTLPQGSWLVLATRRVLTVTTQAGLSVATAVMSLGTAAATADDAALTSTEANILSSQTLGDGTLAAAATEDEEAFTLGTGSAPALITDTAADIDVYLNIGGTFTHASATSVDVTLAGTIELVLLDLGDI